MEPYQQAFNYIHASEDFKRRMVAAMQTRNTAHAARAPWEAGASLIPAKRKALLITIAAVLLLLSACAAYAVYWSSTQRAMQNVVENMEKPAEAVQQEAEAYADSVVKASSLSAPLEGSATVGDVTIQMNAVEVFQEEEGGEYVLYFSARSDSVGFVTSFAPSWLEEDRPAQERLGQYDSFCEIGIDARDFVLTIDGQPYPVYTKPDFEGVPEPASGWNEPGGVTAGTSSLLIRHNPVPITQDSQMSLSGTLYSCDAKGVRTGTIGMFSVDFAYRYPADQAASIRQQSIDYYTKSHAASNAARLESLGNLPTEATPVGLTQDSTTIDDVTVLPDSLLLGCTSDRGWKPADGTPYEYRNAGHELYYINGYQTEPEVMDMTWSEEKVTEPDEYGEYTSRIVSSILKIPYYRATQDMPEELTVYITREMQFFSVTEQKMVDDKSRWPLELVFRVNRTTGAVTLPKDDAEKASWIAEQTALAADGRNDARDYNIHRELTIGDTTLLLERLLYYPARRTFVLYAFIPVIDCEVMPWEIDPVVTLNGAVLAEPQNDTYLRALDPSTPKPFQTNIEEWIDTYGTDPNRFSWYDFTYRAPESMLDMPDSFTLDFTWDVYDLGADATRKFIGTFAFEVPLQKNDYLAFDARNRDYDLQWKRAMIEAYGLAN